MRIRGRPRVTAGIPQASTADVAFLLLIFFIATTTFDTEVGIPLVLPGAVSQPVTLERKDIVIVSSDASGGITVDGNPIALSEVHTVLLRRVQDQPGLVVSIETHPAASYGVMIGILDQVKMARAERISLRLRRG